MLAIPRDDLLTQKIRCEVICSIFPWWPIDYCNDAKVRMLAIIVLAAAGRNQGWQVKRRSPSDLVALGGHALQLDSIGPPFVASCSRKNQE